jgi:antitoxin component of MazEF toxin-antitoxin module
MLRKIFKTGNSSVVSLPRDVTEPLGVREGSDVSVELDRENNRIIIRPVDEPVADAGVDEDFARQVSEFIAQYRPALKSLSRK